MTARRRSSIAISLGDIGREPAPDQPAVEGGRILANPFDVVHGQLARKESQWQAL